MSFRCWLLIFGFWTFNAQGQALPRTADLEGDQFASAITQELDTLMTTYRLFTQMAEERGAVEEVAHSLDLLADQFDKFYARITQFTMWIRFAPHISEEFSAAGKMQLSDLFNRPLPKFTELDASLIPYRSDLRIKAAGERIAESYKNFQQSTGLSQ
jgi:hypothetical protein